MFGHKTKSEGKRGSGWKVLTVLAAVLGGLVVVVWRIIAGRTVPQRRAHTPETPGQTHKDESASTTEAEGAPATGADSPYG